MTSAHYDVLIIGSGFGGSVCAARVAEAGLKVAVLERGRRMTPEAYEALAQGRDPWLRGRERNGLIELHPGRQVSALTASAVGGGSHIYTAVTAPAHPAVFDRRWPEAITWEALQPLYARVEETIAPRPIPLDLPRTAALARAGDALGLPAVRLPLAMESPPAEVPPVPPLADEKGLPVRAPEARGATAIRRQLTTWLQGGGQFRKKTLDKTYLHRAESAGAVVLPLHETTAFAPDAGGWRVRAVRRDARRSGESVFHARCLVLAAGTLNTVRLLLHARDRSGALPRISPALGERFYTNGDTAGLLLCPRDSVPLDAGPPTTAWLEAWDSDRLRLMEINPPLALSAPRPWMIAVMGDERRAYRLRLDRGGRLVCRRSSAPHDAYHSAARRRLKQLARALDARLLAAPTWLERRAAVTVHPLGGAAMADRPEHGVCDSWGEVFGHPRLFVADGSLVPVPIGGAPSMTIAALAERVVKRVIERRL